MASSCLEAELHFYCGTACKAECVRVEYCDNVFWAGTHSHSVVKMTDRGAGIDGCDFILTYLDRCLGDTVACHDLVAQSDVAPYISYANVTQPVLLLIASGPRARKHMLELDIVEFGDVGLHVYVMYSSIGIVDWAGLRRRGQSLLLLMRGCYGKVIVV